MTPRRIEFRVAILRSGLTMDAAANALGVSYNHLILVLDGKRKGSAKLEAAILRVLAQEIKKRSGYGEDPVPHDRIWDEAPRSGLVSRYRRGTRRGPTLHAKVLAVRVGDERITVEQSPSSILSSNRLGVSDRVKLGLRGFW